MNTLAYHSLKVVPYKTAPYVNKLIINTNCTVTLYTKDSDCLFFLDNSYYMDYRENQRNSINSLKLAYKP